VKAPVMSTKHIAMDLIRSVSQTVCAKVSVLLADAIKTEKIQPAAG